MTDRRRPRSPLRRPYDALPSPGPSRRRRSVSRDVRTRSPSSRREDSYERGEIRPPPRQRSPPPVARPRSPDPRDRYARESTSRNRSPPPHTLPRSRQLSPSPPPRSTRDQPSPPRQDSYRRDRSQPVRSPELTRTGYAVESTIPSGPRSRYAVAAPTPSSSSSAWRAPRGPHDTSFQTSERQQPQFARRQSPIESRVDAGSIIPTGPKGWSAGRTPAAPQSTGSYKQGPMSIPPNITTTATISTTSTTTVVGGQHGQAMALAKQQQAILQKAIVVKEAEMRGADDDPYVRTSHSPPPSNDNGNAMSVDVAALPTGPRRVAGFAQMGEEAKQRAAVGAARAAAVAAKLEQAALLRWLPKGKYNPPVVVGIDTESDVSLSSLSLPLYLNVSRGWLLTSLGDCRLLDNDLTESTTFSRSISDRQKRVVACWRTWPTGWWKRRRRRSESRAVSNRREVAMRYGGAVIPTTRTTLNAILRYTINPLRLSRDNLLDPFAFYSIPTRSILVGTGSDFAGITSDECRLTHVSFSRILRKLTDVAGFLHPGEYFRHGGVEDE